MSRYARFEGFRPVYDVYVDGLTYWRSRDPSDSDHAFPRDGQLGTCVRCGETISFCWHPGGGNWIHQFHPEDDHDAQDWNWHGDQWDPGDEDDGVSKLAARCPPDFSLLDWLR